MNHAGDLRAERVPGSAAPPYPPSKLRSLQGPSLIPVPGRGGGEVGRGGLVGVPGRSHPVYGNQGHDQNDSRQKYSLFHKINLRYGRLRIGATALRRCESCRPCPK
jgi:hypothetical protein